MKKGLVWALGLAVLAAATPIWAQEGDEAADQSSSPYTSQDDQISYAIGYQVGQSLPLDSFKFNMDAFTQAVKDVVAGKDSELSQSELQSAMMTLAQRAQQAQQEKAQKNLATAQAFLEENAQKEGVKVTDSGLEYKILKEGTGKSPTLDDTVQVHYRGQLLDGTVFDENLDQAPAEFPVKGLIKGWTEALQMMKVGGKWQLWIPPDLAYGAQGRGQVIPPNSVLVFELTLEGIQE